MIALVNFHNFYMSPLKPQVNKMAKLGNVKYHKSFVEALKSSCSTGIPFITNVNISEYDTFGQK